MFQKLPHIPDKEYADEKRNGKCEAHKHSECKGDVVQAHNSKRTNCAGTAFKALTTYIDSLCDKHHKMEHSGLETFWHEVIAEDSDLMHEWRKKKQERDHLVSLWRRGKREDAFKLLDYLARTGI